jgi:DNA replication protein DnaC
MRYTEADIIRWRRDGISEAQITLWVRNGERVAHDRATTAAHMQDIANRMRRMAPRTPLADAPVVIEQAPQCPRCRDLRVLMADDGHVIPCPHCGADVEAAAARARSLDKYSSASGRAAAQTFEAFRADRNQALSACLDAAVAWADGPEGWLILWGAPGNGKSHLCAAVYNQLRAAGRVSVFITGPELMRSLKALMDDDTAEAEGETVAQRLEKYQRFPVLIIDDLRAEQASAWVDATWFDLLDFRYRNRLPTMIATNCDPAGLDFPARISSRLRDEHDGFSVVLRNTAPDYRIGGSL